MGMMHVTYSQMVSKDNMLGGGGRERERKQMEYIQEILVVFLRLFCKFKILSKWNVPKV